MKKLVFVLSMSLLCLVMQLRTVRPKALRHRGDQRSRITNSVGMSFCYVPQGSFNMGEPDIGYGNDMPSEVKTHRIEITNSFFLGVTEVTRGQYEQVTSQEVQADETTYNMPVVEVSWIEAARFCELLSELPRERNAGRRYRLPTEAEWEYACRSGSSQAFEFTRDQEEVARTGYSGGRMLVGLAVNNVGSFAPNDLGLFDMRGNVFEWCSDWYSRDYYSTSRKKDPQGPKKGSFKVFRGSDWIFSGDGCMLSRHPTEPWRTSPFVGFRVLCEARMANQITTSDSLQ